LPSFWAKDTTETMSKPNMAIVLSKITGWNFICKALKLLNK